MPVLCLSRVTLQPRITTRSVTGLATGTHPTHQVNAPAIWKYCARIEVKEGISVGKAWAIVLVADGATIAPEAAADPDVQFAPDTIALDAALTNQQRNRAQSWIDKSDLGVVVPASVTWRQLLAAVGSALDHSGDFVASLRLA